VSCSVCLKPKSVLKCGLCENELCKTCAQFLNDDGFSFLKVIPEELTCSTYCPQCYDRVVAPQFKTYNETMEKAKLVTVFLKNQSKESRIYKSTEPPIYVEDCPDAEETLLRLAFIAVQNHFNGLVNVDITSKKVRIDGYQTQIWSGVATPTQIHNEKSLRK